ncbi:tripartite tricarboxylate transporter substrate binding protein [Cupriavidus sp. WKF15]|uniref:Bug family tripartite tricarboxylate transporter substrate binding protein n=1 Tax=Cupriavidus sp. WKF15 TaxID=3032282 RepID=UPI0023E1D4DF|nr:tripartite tricarboxylate transporter substrate binding protein [Cupriavidus sp. WKF15]WER48149.1 tripartite tricarboxylate transporter substrate binding protein [Cupriavidus sp. WKF15]
MQERNIASRRQRTAGRFGLAAAALVALACAISGPAAAQSANWPNKPIRMIVPFPAGSFTDTVARVLSEHLSKSLGQSVIVDNKAGANGLIGVAEAARAAPDGYTLLVTNSSSITINHQVYKKSNYKPKDFTPVTLVLEAPFILVTNPEWSQKNGVGTVPDLVKFATQNPGKISYGSAGPGNIAHLSFAMLNNRTRIKTTHIPYKSAAQAEMAVMSGELETAFDTWSALPQIRVGKLKALAVSSPKRMAQLPDVPTLEELGIAPFNVSFWIGMLAPAGTPPQIVQKLDSITRGVLDDSKAKAALGQQGDVVMIDSATFAKRIEKEDASWGTVIQREGITLD